MRSLIRRGVILLAVIGVAVVGLLVYKLRTHGFSARVKPMAVEAWLARHARDLATPSNIKALKNPINLSELTIAEARDHFADHCAVCHGNRGDGKTMMGDGLYPPPPDLADRETQDLTDGEIFNIIQNGIRFTGMPGFGGSDEDNWKLVLFVRHIPKLSYKEVEFMNEVNGMESGGDHENH